jgi:hypothetical protein
MMSIVAMIKEAAAKAIESIYQITASAMMYWLIKPNLNLKETILLFCLHW